MKTYNPALDGLRAIAIILVVFCHFYQSDFSGGAIGVDVFFVLSGYLITSILSNEIARTGSINFKNFFARRALRLMPALLILCAFQFARSPFSEHPSEVRAATVVAMLYLENWNPIFHFSGGDVMGATWSLAVEEQFYLLWPLALLLVIRRPRAWLLGALLAMLAARAALWQQDMGVLNHTLLRPVGLLVGCLLALTPSLRRADPWSWAAPCVVVAIVALAFFSNETSKLWIEITPMIAAVLAAVAIVFARPDCFLAFAPLRYIGRISYGLYLYHMPILILAKSHRVPHLPAIVLIAISVGIAAMSYEFVEGPILRFKDRFSDKTPRQIPLAEFACVNLQDVQ